jgi:hypothetical protein
VSTGGTEFSEQETEHGLLVAMGQFAQETGLLAGLSGVRIAQKVASHQEAITPQTKLIEFAAGILAGIASLQDLSLGAQPLANDAAVAEAWGQVRLVHFTNVGRTLKACTATTVSDLRAVIDRFNQPFLSEALADELLAGREIELDVDLMGQAVSTTSKSYLETGFGWMGSAVRLGYQVARVCVQTRRRFTSRVVVAFVETQMLRLAFRGPWSRHDDRLERGLQQLGIVHVGSGHDNGQRPAVSFR